MELNTQRLHIIPLDLEQFQLLLSSMDKLEESLHLDYSKECLDNDTKQAISELYKLALSYLNEIEWYTNWQIILKKENNSIGSACFKEVPDESKTVELGYGIHLYYRNKGYIKEAVNAICA